MFKLLIFVSSILISYGQELTSAPTMLQSYRPSTEPTIRPTFTPTSLQPSYTPTSLKPTSTPSISPTSRRPTIRPTLTPSTWKPTHIPSSLKPSMAPIRRPSVSPTAVPSAPTKNPTYKPSATPTHSPSCVPTARPTGDASCPGGTYINRSPTSYECTTCLPGTYSNANFTSCEACPLNFYAENSGATVCVACPSGNVNGGVGSFSRDDCVNPSINFVLGLVSLAFGAVMIVFYIGYGRLQLIAFERRLWMVDSSITIYSIALNLMMKTQKICNTIASTLAKELQAREDAILREGSCSSFAYVKVIAKRIIRPIAFTVVFLCVATLIIAGTLVSAIAHVLFNALLIFRGYKIYVNIDFSFYDRIAEFLSKIGFALNLSFIVNEISYPIIYILNLLSNLSINLANVKVTCSGSQAPIFLLLDCMLVAVVVLTISSNIHVFWSTVLKQSTMQFGVLLLNQHYINSFCNSLGTPIYTVASFLLYIFPSPMKINQYLLSFISVDLFFANHGVSKSSSNCDTALGPGFPIDTFEAVSTTVLAIIAIPPVIYMFAQILYPASLISSTFSHVGYSAVGQGQGWSNTAGKIWRTVTAATPVDWVFMKVLFNFAWSLQSNLQYFLFSIEESFSGEKHRRVQTALQKHVKVFQDPLDGVTIPITTWLHLFDYTDLDSADEGASKKEDLLKLQDQFPSYLAAFAKVVEDAKRSNLQFRNNPIFSSLFALAGCGVVPIQLYFSSLARKIWYNVMMHYIMYFFMSVGWWTNSMQSQLSLVDNFTDFEEKMINPSEWERERRSSIASAGMVPNPLATGTTGTDDEDATTLMGDVAVPRRVPSIAATGNRKRFDILEYERKTNFMAYLSAMTSCRSVMWQLIPGMTGFALFSVDTASCPIFIFSNEMTPIMTPLLVCDAWTIAKERIHSRTGDREKKLSCLEILLCACYIFTEESRFVQFLIAVMINFVAYCIIFSSVYLEKVFKLFLVTIIFTGCVRVGYAVVPLYKFFFPAEAAVEESLEQPFVGCEDPITQSDIGE